MVWAPSKESLLEKCKSRLSLVKRSATCGPDFIRQGQGALLPVCWLDILQSNIVYGCRVLASWVHVQESYCFQVKPGLIMQRQRDIHTYTQQRTHAPTRFFTRTSSTLKVQPSQQRVKRSLQLCRRHAAAIGFAEVLRCKKSCFPHLAAS